MRGKLLGELNALIEEIESAQSALSDLYSRKRAALVEARAEEIVRVVEVEASLLERIRELLTRRARLLQRAQTGGLPAESLAALAGALDGSDSRALALRIDWARQRSEQLRRENWAQWIIAQRASRHFGELIDLVAEHGRRPPDYSAGSRRYETGGALLDATA